MPRSTRCAPRGPPGRALTSPISTPFAGPRCRRASAGCRAPTAPTGPLARELSCAQERITEHLRAIARGPVRAVISAARPRRAENARGCIDGRAPPGARGVLCPGLFLTPVLVPLGALGLLGELGDESTALRGELRALVDVHAALRAGRELLFGDEVGAAMLAELAVAVDGPVAEAARLGVIRDQVGSGGRSAARSRTRASRRRARGAARRGRLSAAVRCRARAG